MKFLRSLSGLLASCGLLTVSAISLHASVVWNGSEDTVVSNNNNWDSPGLAGGGVDDVEFGDISNSGFLLVVPAGGAVALNSLSFTGAERPAYTFAGDPALGSSLALISGLTVQNGSSDVIFDHNLSVVLAGGTVHTVDVVGGATVWVNGKVSEFEGSASIDKIGCGTLSLSGANNFSGGVSVHNGTLLLGSSSQLDESNETTVSSPVGFGGLKLYSGSTLGVSVNDVWLNNNIALDCSGGLVNIGLACNQSLTLAGNISGPAELSQTGNGTLTLLGVNSDLTGGVALHGGTLVLGNNSDVIGTGELKLYAGTTLSVTSGSNLWLSNTIALDCSGGTVNIGLACNDRLGLSGTISGSAGLNLTGGTLALSGGNTFDGGVTVQGGATLLLGSSSHVTEQWVPTETESGYYQLVICNGPVGTDTLKLENGGTLGLVDGRSYTLHNDIDLACFGDSSATIATGSGNLSLMGTISGSAALTKTGSGTLTLTSYVGENASYGGHNTFSGGLTVQAGTLAIGTSTLNDDGILTNAPEFISSGPVGTGTLTLNSGTTLTTASLDDVTLANDIRLSGSGHVTFAFSNEHYGVVNDVPGWYYDSLTLGGSLSGCATIDLYGAGNINDGWHNGGNLNLLGDNSGWSGGLNIYGDNSVYVYGNTGLGTGTLWFASASNAKVEFESCAPSIGGLSGGHAGSIVQLDSGTTLTIDQNSSTSFAGTITGPGAIVKDGCGDLTLSGANTFGGGFTLAQGTLILGSSTLFNESAEIASGPVGTGTLKIDDDATLSAIGMGIQLWNPIELTCVGSVNLAAESNSSLWLNGALTGTTAINKTGAGTVYINHDNTATFTGNTNVQSGLLVANVSGALGNGGTIALQGGSLKIGPSATLTNPITFGSESGGTLTGNYTFNDHQTFGTGVTLSPGNSPGTMTFAAGWAPVGTPTTNFEFNAWSDSPGVNSDLIIVNGGAFDLSGVSAGGYTLKLISLSFVGGNSAGAIDGTAVATTWTLFQTGSTLSASDLTKFTIDSTDFFGGGVFSLNLDGSNQNIVLNFTPVPEPSTCALLALGAGLSGFAAWRKRRRM